MVLRKCTICDRRFKKTEHFKRHERSHTNERPYECNICHKRFSRSDVLSRHAKGHNKQGGTPATGTSSKNVDAADQVRTRRTSVITGVSTITAGPENGMQLFPAVGADVHQLSNLSSTPRDTSLPTAGMPPSSLDFLADISAHQVQAHKDQDLHAMMIEDQYSYLGWNGISPATQTHPNGIPNELLQLWLEPRAHTASNHGSMELARDSHFPLMGDNVGMSDQQNQHALHSGKSGGDNIPNERFTRVQRCWLAPNPTGRLMNSIWRDLVSNDLDNLFSMNSFDLPSEPSHLQESRHGVDESCKRSLQMVFGQPMVEYPQMQPRGGYNALSPATMKSGTNPLPDFPPTEILDMALDLYFRTFHPLVPIVHLPTFSAKKTRLPLLYVMCLIGMTMLDTKGTTTFVSRTFNSTLEKVTAELAKCSLRMESPSSGMSIFATAVLFLNLAALTGEKAHLEQCQMFYVNLMSIAQRHGLFAATEGQILDMSLFEAVHDNDMRWKAWSNVESAKRIIIGLLLLDLWYSSFLSTSPIVAPDSIQLILPCSETLFRAHSSMRWRQLIQGGERILMPTVPAPSENINIPTLDGSLDDFCLQALLAMVKVRQAEAYHRLLSNRARFPFAPCHTYAMDGRARCLPSLQSQLATKYVEAMGQINPNALIMWHSMCMTLTADIQIFDLAAGRAGPFPARKALDEIAEWAQTPAARRACLHAVQIYKAMANRKTSDHPTFHSVFSLFCAALVLGLYTFMVPDSATTSPSSIGSIELMDDDIDWAPVGTEGFTSFMEPRGSQAFSPTDNPAVHFIRNGATIYLRGVPLQGGYQSARRILLDYASLLKDSGKWTVTKFSYVLHIMSDVLMDME